MEDKKKSAFVAVVGRPSVGKSTLVNLLCGAKVAIVSSVPQTTRNAIRGIVSKPDGQLVFVDTPGRHTSERKLNKKLMEVSDRAVGDSELILYVLDASRAPGSEEEAVAEMIKPLIGKTIVAINKMDMQGANAEKAIVFLQEQLPDLPREHIFNISCLKKEGIEPLLACLFEMAEPGDPFYPEEYYTDQDIPFRIAEIIREKAMNRLRDELPHSLYVEVADTELKDTVKESGEIVQKLWVRAFIITERESQKGMVVGKGGEMIKAIRQAAQKELNSIFDWKVELDLRVKTGKDWRHNDHVLHRIIDRQ
ncbi:GTPase Era [Leadbettera azotonutricia]|uniref:GTPase Era n=1 Tax=Leadbettera azotonutricia (strain ATCC BAA-888 / DSM 13862 / ZAS-9) TaxID=545695 RepID=F5YFM9_LEAAZ|nr:GTPase Era [Leadbettera azotonutricia]AEF82877.1 GTP-binding protein Era [Leadbettera azotonutricia ZAS-9]